MNSTNALVIPVPEDLLPVIVFGLISICWVVVVLFIDRRRKERTRLRERLGAGLVEDLSEEQRLVSRPPAAAKSASWQVFWVPLVAIAAAAVWILTGREFLGFAIFAVGYGGIALYRRRRIRLREESEERHALAAIETAGRVLKAGIPLPGMIDLLAKDASGEAGGAFRQIVTRGELGEDLASSIGRVLPAGPRSGPSVWRSWFNWRSGETWRIPPIDSFVRWSIEGSFADAAARSSPMDGWPEPYSRCFRSSWSPR